jgi:fibronectin type 3 domain-containing protein
VTASALGLRFVDKTVERNKHYIYRVFPSIPSPTYSIDTAYLVLENLNFKPIPQPVYSETYGSENKIVLSWDKTLHESLFSAYIIERSDNEGLTFKALSDIPFINPESDNINNKLNVFQYTDSVPKNYVPYHYRLVGITAFGEKSPPSEVVVEMGRDRTPPPAPINVDANLIGDGVAKITWEMPNPPPDLDGFYIGRGDNLDKNFQPIHEQKIPKDSTSFIDYYSNKLSGNYYVIAAVDTAGNGSISMVSYAAVLDSIPPSAPVGLTGSIDSTGLVTLQWSLGDEIDLAGYMIYFTNAADHVYSTVNEAPLGDTIYTDTIQIKTLTRKIYYKIKAVDTRWNYSEYSDVLELTRPDIIPPTSAVFTKYKLTEEGIHLEWIPSSSYDVAGYALEIYTNQKLTLKVYVEKRDSLKIYTYTDKKVEPGNVYTYVVTTVDESGLRSEPSSPISVKSVDFKPKKPIDDLSVLINKSDNSAQLTWSYDADEKLKRFILYRAVEGSSFVAYKSLAPTDNSFKDNMIRKGVKYEYTLKAVYNNGKQTPFSNIASVSID